MNRFHSLLSLLCCAIICIGCSESTNNGIKNPAPENSQYPYLYSTNESLYMSWLTPGSSETYTLQYAQYKGNQWSKTDTVAAGTTWFINWADFPSLIADDDGPLAAHWLNKKQGGPYAYDINITTADSSGNWGQVMTPHKDSTATEHGFVSMIPLEKKRLLAVWLDGRQTAGRDDNEYADITKAMTLRGAIISQNGKLLKQFLIDDSVCDCCPTSLVKSNNGAVVAYRDRTDDEIRDIYVSRFDGQNWSQPTEIYSDKWQIGGCPVNGPNVAASDSTVAVAWYTGADENHTTKVVVSEDNGKTFSDPIHLNENESLGRTDAAIKDEKIYVSWMEEGQKKNPANLQLAIINRKNYSKKIKTISPINEARKTGFPQMVALRDHLFFAWTGKNSLKMMKIRRE